jgi:hypothetical protein
MLINSQINDAETSLTPVQVESYSEKTLKSLIKSASSIREKSVNEKNASFFLLMLAIESFYDYCLIHDFQEK